MNNLILNGGVAVTQAGTSFTAPANGDYVLDVWEIVSGDGGGAAPTIDVKRASTTPFVRLPYSIELDITNVGTPDAGRSWYIIQRPADVNPYKGKTITVSVMLSSSAALNLNGGGRFRIRDNVATTSVNIDSLSTSWETFSLTHTIDSAATLLRFEFGIIGNNAISATESIYIAASTEVFGTDQAWFGIREKAVEAKLVHYLYERLSPDDDEAICTGSVNTTTEAKGTFHFLPKRVVPTITVSDNAHFQILAQNTDYVASATAIEGITETAAIIDLTITGATAGDAGVIKSHSASAWIDIDARP